MNDNAKKWVDALRSEEFKQSRGQLYRESGYCCLGVACELYQREIGGLKHEWKHRFHLGGDMEPVKSWLGLATFCGSYKPNGYQGDGECDLTCDNDVGKTFQQIADIIESEPEGLFIDATEGTASG